MHAISIFTVAAVIAVIVVLAILAGAGFFVTKVFLFEVDHSITSHTELEEPAKGVPVAKLVDPSDLVGKAAEIEMGEISENPLKGSDVPFDPEDGV